MFDATFRQRTVPQFSSRKWRYSRAANLLARRRNTIGARLITRAAHAWIDATQNVQFDITTDGEMEMLRQLRHADVSTVFDVGANIGGWAATAARTLCRPHVHCFELDAENRVLLERHVAKLDGRFTVAPRGLDRERGTVSYDFYPEETALTSILRIPHSSPAERRQADVMTGDEYMENNRIDRVDLLKVDVEGTEGRVLEGFSQTLREERVRVVQFEYGLANVVARCLLADMYRLLEEAGFSVGRLFPDGVDFRPYELTAETFRGGNFVAVHANEVRLAQQLAATGKR
ncbi:FkbM family methyltransferase [Streptomyces sp. NPDC059785]|uniref:FkbM family methyltransferase n=1 Tax=unclassified Streptomyces TaxID=2593676 RepID=UPI00365ED3B4